MGFFDDFFGGGNDQRLDAGDLQALLTGPTLAGTALEGMAGLGVGDFLDFIENPLELRYAEQAGMDYLDRLAQSGMIDEMVGNLEGLQDPLEELLTTGYRVDLDPIVRSEQRRFEDETVPGLAQQFGRAITGSGFREAVFDAGEDLGITLGGLQVGADEAAAARRLSGLQIAPAILREPATATTDFVSLLGQLGGAQRAAEESTRPGSRFLQALSGLSGVEGGQQFVIPGYSNKPSGLESFANAFSTIIT